MIAPARRVTSRLGNLFWELRLGVSTRGLSGLESATTERIFYGTIPYKSIFLVLERLGLTPSDVFVDLGCGKGRVLCCAALSNVEEVIGIEYSEELCRAAESNTRSMRGRRSPISVMNIAAEEFDYLRGTVFYLFHPFGENTLREVLLRMQAALYKKVRPIRIAYVNPFHQAVLRSAGWLEEYEHWDPGHAGTLEVAVSYWRPKL